jgi:adenylylsulfate kinase-like enzyme
MYVSESTGNPERDGYGVRERTQQNKVTRKMKVLFFTFLALALSGCGKSEVDKCVDATYEAKLIQTCMHDGKDLCGEKTLDLMCSSSDLI